MRKFNLNKKLIILNLIMLLLITIITGCGEESSKLPTRLSDGMSEKLTIHFIDVGQADAILVQLPNEESILIDAGNNDDGQMVVDYINQLKIDRIDYLIGTHPHEDHIGGLDNVINNFETGKVYMPQVNHTTETYRELLTAIKAKGKKSVTAQAGKELINTDELEVKLLGPVKEHDELNNWSVVTKIKYGNNSFLFTGDMESEAEKDILNAGFNLESDLLKVAHHGSSSSTTQSFLEAVKPKYGIISVGSDNDYGHPSSFTLQRLKDYGVKIYRTDKQGTIIAVSNGQKITFNQEPTEFKLGDSSMDNRKSKVDLIRLDLKEEIVVIKNNSKKNINLTNWNLVSIRGNQEFTFPDRSIIKAGKTYKVTSGRRAKSGTNMIIWTEGYMWNNGGDAAALYDENQNLESELSRY